AARLGRHRVRLAHLPLPTTRGCGYIFRTMSDLERLEQLLRSHHTCIAVSTFEEQQALSLIRDAAINLNRQLWIWSVAGGVREGLVGGNPGLPQSEEPLAGLSNLLAFEHRPLCVTLDIAAHLRNDKVMRTLRNTIQQFDGTGAQLILIDYAAE